MLIDFVLFLFLWYWLEVFDDGSVVAFVLYGPDLGLGGKKS